MNQPLIPSLKSLLPSEGLVFHTVDRDDTCPILAVSRDLCKIAACLQEHHPYATLVRIEDWWEHDGLYFDRGTCDWHAVFDVVGSPRSLLNSMQGDDRVNLGVGTADRAFYLRFLVDWDDTGVVLWGRYSVTLNPTLAASLAATVTRELTCLIEREDAASYFDKILAG
jgi:hypothetical protein